MNSKRNVVLVTIDSLRADRCGFLGSDRNLTPAMDRLAREGLTFEHAIAPGGSTRGSVTSFFTGQYPIARPTASSRNQVIQQHIRATESLPELFSRMGYETAGFTANPWTSNFFGFDDGFDSFEDFLDQDLTKNLIAKNKKSGFLGLGMQVLNWIQGQDMFMSWDSFYDEIKRWLNRTRSPYFLWVFLVDVHMPYLPPAEYRSNTAFETYAANAWLFTGQETPFDKWFQDRLTTAYDDTVKFVDAFVNQLSQDIDKETLLCVHADHGEKLGEHDSYGHGSLHEEVVHVPLFVGNVSQARITAPFSLRGLPDLLVQLATEDEFEYDRGYVTTRNNATSRLVRGETWRYHVTADKEEFININNKEIKSGDTGEVRDLCHRILKKTVESENERRRLIAASADIAANGRL